MAVERRIDFSRDRCMLCAGCGHRFVADLDWIDRWEHSGENCPGCGLTCEHKDAPRVTVDPDDPGLDDERVAHFSWYHTSTQPDWPTKDFDPAAALTPETRMRMGGGGRVAAWAARQRAKALHVGTYEAAIHNMLRRMENQADSRSRFHVYRVRLRPDVVVREGWLIDPSDWLGDVVLEQVCPQGIDVARYLNYHEDPGGISLALGRGAIAEVQQTLLPLPGRTPDNKWERDASAALESESDVAVPAAGKLGRFMPPVSPRSNKAREIATALAGRLPANLRSQFESAVEFGAADDPGNWAKRTNNLITLIEEPQRVLAALDAAKPRKL